MAPGCRLQARVHAAACAAALVLATTFTASALPVAAQEASATTDPFEDWDAFVEDSMERWNVPGVAMAVVMDGEIVLARGYGYRDVERRLPMRETTVMPIGSASKAFTGLLLGLLVEDGKLAWNEPVRTWLPELALSDETRAALITPLDLLTHRSGFPRHDLAWYAAPFSREELFRQLRYLEPSEGFRAAFRYNNLMYMTAGYLAERVAGPTWEEQVRTRILEPLGMRSSGFSIDWLLTEAEEYAYGYRAVDEEEGEGRNDRPQTPPEAAASSSGRAVGERARERKRLERMAHRPIDAIGPAGSINSNVLDLSRWLLLQLGEGTVDGEEVVPASVMATAHAPHVVVDEPVFRFLYTQPEMPYMMYGLGWFIHPYRGHRYIHHGGSIDGFASLVGFLPDDDIGIAVLTNLNGNPLSTVLALSLYDRLLDLEPVDWNDRLEELWERAMEMAREGSEGDEAVPGTSPSHPLDDYVGVYSHPAYGEVRVTRDGDLRIQFREFRIGLKHFHYDLFEGTFEPPLQDRKVKVEFFTNQAGTVDRLSLPLEPSVAPIVFERIAPSEAAGVPDARSSSVGPPLSSSWARRPFRDMAQVFTAGDLSYARRR